MYYVYILKSISHDKLYIGYTSDLKRRFTEHNLGKSIATKAYIPYRLIYYEAYSSKSDALKREIKLKQYNQTLTRLKQRLTYSLKEQS
jgi:putative endonuclease